MKKKVDIVPYKSKADERAAQAQEASCTPVLSIVRTVVFKKEWQGIAVGESNYLRFQQMKESVYNENSSHKYFYKTMVETEVDLWLSFVDTELSFLQLLDLVKERLKKNKRELAGIYGK